MKDITSNALTAGHFSLVEGTSAAAGADADVDSDIEERAEEEVDEARVDGLAADEEAADDDDDDEDGSRAEDDGRRRWREEENCSLTCSVCAQAACYYCVECSAAATGGSLVPICGTQSARASSCLVAHIIELDHTI